MIDDLVSTIIPVFNRAAMLREAVASLLAQTYRPIEVIIVDDGSTDIETPAAIRELASKHEEIRSTRIANGGPGVAREAGRQLARGEFIQYLDSDDLLLPHKFELQVAALRARSEAGVAYGLTRYRNSAGQEIACEWKHANQRQETILPSFLVSRWWDTATPLYRRSVTDAAGAWTTLHLEEDWEYDCRIGALGIRLAYVDDFVAEIRDHSDNRLSRGAARDAWRLSQRAQSHQLVVSHARRAGIPPSSPEMQHFARELFHLSRQCGAAALVAESRALFHAARLIGSRWDLTLYAAAARTIGWTRAGKLSMIRERFQ